MFLQALQSLFSCSFPEKEFVLHSERQRQMETNYNEERNTRALLDNLFEEVRSFRYGKDVKALFEYCRRMQHLSAYNAALVYTQQPGNRLVLTASQWDREGRLVKPNSRPLIILLPFGPVGFVYDISDTVPKYGTDSDSEKEFLINRYINHPFTFDQKDLSAYTSQLKKLEYNMPFFGIKYEMMRAGSALAANIKTYNDAMIDVPIEKNPRGLTEATIKYGSRFWLSVNDKAKTAEELASLTHELGHLFCHHLYVSDSWWKYRKLSDNSREFEAESTAWLICSRLGIDSRSAEYLYGYKDDDLIPPVSFESIFTAVNTIEKMIRNRMTFKEGYLYKYDKNFKRIADEEVARLKMSRIQRRN